MISASKKERARSSSKSKWDEGVAAAGVKPTKLRLLKAVQGGGDGNSDGVTATPAAAGPNDSPSSSGGTSGPIVGALLPVSPTNLPDGGLSLQYSQQQEEEDIKRTDEAALILAEQEQEQEQEQELEQEQQEDEEYVHSQMPAGGAEMREGW